MKNQPAFPLNVSSVNAIEYSGMTLRDYFAAKAMQTLCQFEKLSVKEITGLSYKMADAMLKERTK